MLDFTFNTNLMNELGIYYNVLCSKKSLDDSLKNNNTALYKEKI